MKDHDRDDESKRGLPIEPDDGIAALVRSTDPRRADPDERANRVRAAVLAHWRVEVRRRSRRRRLTAAISLIFARVLSPLSGRARSRTLRASRLEAIGRRSFGRAFFRYRNHLASLPLVFALVSTTGEWETDLVIWPVATSLSLAGVALRAWSSLHCNYAQGKKMVLACTGPYAYVRNPLYIGNVLIIAGATVASELVWLLPASVAWSVAVYSATAGYEARDLSRKYGDQYSRYRSAVPAWLPSLRGGRRVVDRSSAPEGTAQDSPVGVRSRPFARAVFFETSKLLSLLPFVMKELIA